MTLSYDNKKTQSWIDNSVHFFSLAVLLLKYTNIKYVEYILSV